MVVGYFVDAYLGSSPWCLIAFTAMAFIAAFVRLIQWARFFARERDGNRSEEDDSQN